MKIEPFKEEDFGPVVRLCRSLGADERQSEVMARQLLRRAGQIAEERRIDPYAAMEQLLRATVEGRNGRNPFGGEEAGREKR